ncbi:MAG TPA: hypothetical protein VII96_09880 [Acidimicrobiales bacterium]
MSRLRDSAPTGLACIFTVTGVLHFVRPAFFDPLMPRMIAGRFHRPLIYGSGVAELACAAGLFRRSRWASAASTAVLLAVWPANLQMALDAGSGRHPDAMDSVAVAWGRMPLQLPMLWAARQAHHRAHRTTY